MENTGFKQWIKKQSQEKGFRSVRALAKAAGVSWGTIYNLMNNTQEAPRLSTLIALAEPLGVSVEFLRTFWGFRSDMPKLTHLQMEIIDAIEGLPSEHQSVVVQLVRALSATSKNARYFAEIQGALTAGGLIDQTRLRKPVEIPADLIRSTRPHFALQICGDSLINAGIRDGDTVLIRESTDPAEWVDQICVARIANLGMTLRYWRKNERQVTLEAANPDFKNFGPYSIDQVEGLGVFVGVIPLLTGDASQEGL